jgi:uncharacterized protein
MIQRDGLNALDILCKQFRGVCVTGPRQSRKTTLLKNTFTNKPYISLEDPDVLAEAEKNPRKFLAQFKQGAIIDEAQRMPSLFNYMQSVLDNTKKRGLFILSGSNNFLRQESITQSLAGRVGYLELLPLSYNELQSHYKNKALDKYDLMLKGGYPELYQFEKAKKELWFKNYLQTYIERNVRLLRNINNILGFQAFVKYCAALAGQQIQIQKISNDLGINNKTISDWLNILQASYIVYLLPPYFSSYFKRITKSSKLYFYDTGLLCYLLDITSKTSLQKSSQKGAIFENFVINEIRKNKFNTAEPADQYYLRDSTGNEVDLLQKKGEDWYPIEIKSSEKFNPDMLRGLRWYEKISLNDKGILFHGGNTTFETNLGVWCNSWKDLRNF